MDINALKKLKGPSLVHSNDSKKLTINKKDGEMCVWDKYKDEAIYWKDTDRNGKYDTKVVVLGKHKPTIYKLNEKQNNINKIQVREWNQIDKEFKQDYTEKSKRYKKFGILIDGEISGFEQSEITGDCWLLSGLHAMSLTLGGQRCIKNAISQDNKGNVKVHLKGVNESYTFSPDQIFKANAQNAVGDDDVAAIEMAIAKHRLNLIKSGKGTNDYSPNEPHLDKRIGAGNLKAPLDGGSADEIFFLLSGEKSKYYSSKRNINSFFQRLFSNGFLSDIDGCLSQMQNKNGKYAGVVSFKENKGKMFKNHGYSIKYVDKENVTLVNPWNTGDSFKLKRKNFIENFDQLVVSDLSE